MVIFGCIKEEYCDAIVSNCAEKGCKIDLREIENYIILKGEKICKDRKICDHIIFIGNNSITIVIVEFKSKNAKASEIEEKLYNCSNFELKILEKYIDNSFTYDFYHYVIVKSWRPPEYRKIVNTKLNIGGKRYNIIPKRLKVSLANSLSNFKN